jgi:putative oxidoreductase
MMIDMYATPATGLRPLIDRAISIVEAVPGSALQLLTRLGVAAVFFKSGLVKIQSWPQTLALFAEEYRVPLIPAELAAPMATFFELACPVALVLGLASRLATLPLIGMTLVIQLFVFPSSWAEHLTWAALLLSILVRGPGILSLDHLVRRHFDERDGRS